MFTERLGCSQDVELILWLRSLLPSDMEDPWSNAWSQPDTLPEKTPRRSPLAKRPDVNSIPWAVEDGEADVGEPSWSTGGIDWNQPSAQSSIWSSTTVDDVVEHNPYGGWQAKIEQSTTVLEEKEVEEIKDGVQCTSFI